jgi:catechol 2,3-dioxygenase
MIMGAIEEKIGAIATRVRPMLTHAAIYVWDLPKMASFYETVLGLVRTDQGHSNNAGVDFIFFTNDASEHHQFVLVTGRPRDVKFSVVNQLSFLVGSLAEVREAYRRAQAMGAKVQRCVSHGNAWSVYIHDPEGNVVEVYTHTPWYVPQPHMDLIDLTKSDDEIYRETEALCRKDPAFCTREEWVARTAARLKN